MAKLGSQESRADFRFIPEVYFAHLPDVENIPLILEKDLPPVRKTHFCFLNNRPGNGHKRVAFDVSSSFGVDTTNGCLRKMEEVPKTTADQFHQFGSNNKLGRGVTEFLQRHATIQKLIPWYAHRLVLKNDAQSVLETAEHFLLEIIERKIEQKDQSNEETVFVAFHPDIAYVLAEYKTGLEAWSGLNIKIAVVMTDHLPQRSQFLWYLTGVDYLFVPDQGSAALAQQELEYWNHPLRNGGKKDELPEVITIPYPVNPALIRDASPENQEKRIRKLQAENEERVDILLPMGGATPDPDYYIDFVRALPRNMFKARVLVKCGNHTTHLENEMEESHAQVIKAGSAQESLAGFVRLCHEYTPEFIVSKPSELHALALIPPEKVGGAVVLFAKPVGDQEYQNLWWLRQHGLVPSEAEQKQMWQADEERLREFVVRAQNWRGIEIPDDPADAALFVVKAKRAGIFEAMMQYNRLIEDHSEISYYGARIFWEKLWQNLVHEEAQVTMAA